MIEGILTWDLLPGVDQKAYGAWAQKAIGTVMQQPGLIEFRANRNLLGTPQVRVVTLWNSAADWANFAENTWPALEAEQHVLVTNLHVELWGPSPVVPEPLRPKS